MCRWKLKGFELLKSNCAQFQTDTEQMFSQTTKWSNMRAWLCNGKTWKAQNGKVGRWEEKLEFNAGIGEQTGEEVIKRMDVCVCVWINQTTTLSDIQKMNHRRQKDTSRQMRRKRSSTQTVSYGGCLWKNWWWICARTDEEEAVSPIGKKIRRIALNGFVRRNSPIGKKSFFSKKNFGKKFRAERCEDVGACGVTGRKASTALRRWKRMRGAKKEDFVCG